MIEIIRLIIIGFVLILLQTLIFQEVNILWWIKPLPYIYLIFIIPISANKFGVLIGAFFFGLTMDAFGGSMGMHTAACVSLVFIKNYIDRYFVDENSLQLQGLKYVKESYKGWKWYYLYCFSIILIHHLLFFTFDYFSWSNLPTILWVSFASALFSLLGVQIIKFLLVK